MAKHAQYGLILSVKKWYTFFDWILYFILNFKSYCKTFIYTLIKSNKVYKYKRNIYDEISYEIIEGVKYPIIGHKQLQMSLIRGFKDLQIPLAINNLAENAIILWADKYDLHILKRLKKQGKLKKIITVPTACKYDYNDLGKNFVKYDCIDMTLVASDWVKKEHMEIVDKKYWDKIKTWYSGVKIPNYKLHKPYRKCIVYYKRLPINDDITNFIKELGIECNIIEYGKYNFDNWQNLLKQVDFIIFYQDYRETQGLAIAEAWANNVPTFIKANEQFSACPYLNEQNGCTYKTINELKQYIYTYNNDPQKFLNQFTPQKYIMNNMSDKISVSKLITIFDEIIRG